MSAARIRLGRKGLRFQRCAGLVVIMWLIAPYRVDRQMARSIIGPDRFIKAHVTAALRVRERRDAKGLCSRARAGKITDFAGIGSAYEVPARPDVESIPMASRHLARCGPCWHSPWLCSGTRPRPQVDELSGSARRQFRG